MTELSERVAPLFKKTKTVCFGRFMVDVPETATVVWADSIVPLTVSIYQNGIAVVDSLAEDFIRELESEKAIYQNDVPLLLSVSEVTNPDGRIVTGYENFESINDLQVRGYFKFGVDGLVINARPLRSDVDGTIALIKSIARRLRHRTDTDFPFEPGNCIEHAFLPDMENPGPEDLMEHIRIGFRLREFPDVHFSVYVAPSNPNDPEGDSLERQFKRFKEDPATPEEAKVLAGIKYFRESPRRIQDWLTGYEVLMRTPDEEGSLSHHDFQMKFTGVPHDPYKPYADIQLQTGVADDAAGAGKSSLTDDEAIAVWDKITGTIRVRPTEDPAKRSATDTVRLPLGELAATGRICPQTGWWQAGEANGVDTAARRHFYAGERMPHVILAGRPSFWQKLKGEDALYRVGTIWKLVDYGDVRSNVATAAERKFPSGRG